jgi:next to BRCA1 gene 1 protein
MCFATPLPFIPEECLFALNITDSASQLRFLLAVPPDAEAIFERFSDSAGSYVTLDSNKPAIYKQLYRAAKAKLKLRIKATVIQPPTSAEAVPNIMDEQQQAHAEPLRLPTPPQSSPAPRPTYLDTVLSITPASRQFGSYTVPAVSAFGTQAPAAIMSMVNATNDTLVTPPKIESEKALNTDTSSKVNPIKNTERRQDLFGGAFCIDCNHCGKSIPDEHYHCGTCDDGDFDLCLSCIEADVTCDEEGHWLIKRRIHNGLLVSSVTETIAPKKWEKEPVKTEEKTAAAPQYAPRTCNSCINGKDRLVDFFIAANVQSELPGEDLVTCTNCADFDLCMMCFSLGDHGHHPGHRFQPVSADTSKISSRVLSLCEPSRGLAHAAICDGCDKARQDRPTPINHADWDHSTSLVFATNA